MATKKKSSKARTTKSSIAHPEESTVSKTSRSADKKKPIMIGVLIVIAIALLYAMRGWFVAATVNGKPISRISVIKNLEKQSGKQALDSLVTENLITQEIKKRGVVVSDEELAAELATIETNLKSQGQDIEAALSQSGMTREELRSRINIQKALEKIIGDKIKVSTAEIDTFIEENQEIIPQDTTPEALQVQVRDQLSQQKLSEEISKFVEDLRKKANINYFVEYGTPAQ